MVNLLLPFETDDDGESEAATTLRRGRFDVGVGDIADVFRRRVALAGKFPLNSWMQRRRNSYRRGRRRICQRGREVLRRVFDVAEPASPKPGNGGIKLLEAVSNVIGDNINTFTNTIIVCR